MRYCEALDFGEGIKGVRLGWSLAGPPMMTVLCYWFDHIMIDTGLAHMQKTVVDSAQQEGIERVLLTHHHEDHSGNAAAIHKATHADVFGSALTRKKMEQSYPILPYQKYVWGRSTPVVVKDFPDQISTPLGRIQHLPTPGHSKDHTVFFLPEKGILFSGDLFLADRIKYFRADEDLGNQIASLKRVLRLDFDTLLCAHNPKQDKGKDHLRRKLGFLEHFYGNVVQLWEKGLGERQIFRRMNLKEDYFIKFFCFGNVSMMNGVRSVIRHHLS
jgi:glyoxylase-like metal-dependent hydrolase (beta-lactamase superfamily II)